MFWRAYQSFYLKPYTAGSLDFLFRWPKNSDFKLLYPKLKRFVLFSRLHCNIDPILVSSIHSIRNCANTIMVYGKLSAERDEVGCTSF